MTASVRHQDDRTTEEEGRKKTGFAKLCECGDSQCGPQSRPGTKVCVKRGKNRTVGFVADK